jgi:hypothetical protein
MRGIDRIRELPKCIEHLALGDRFAPGRGAVPGRLLWFLLWTYRRSGLEVFPGDRVLAEALGMTIRQVQDGLRYLEAHGSIERSRKRRGRSTVPKRVIRLCPTVEPARTGTFELPQQISDLRRLCAGHASRPQVDMAVMLGLWLICHARRHFDPRADYSAPVKISLRCIAHLLGLSRNTPRKSIDRLAKLDLVRPTHAGDDWSCGWIVAAPSRWAARSPVEQSWAIHTPSRWTARSPVEQSPAIRRRP